MTDVELTDPLGRSVKLLDRTWFGHIVRGHPEVAAYRNLVEETVTRPERILLSNSDTDCRLYFGKGPRSGVRILVVADVVLGIVKTAHLARKISGGAVEWS
jgi:hypothetical protein